MAVKRKKIDWEKIEIDYRAGVKTLREIADEHGISHGAINKRAKRDGWTRDLSTKIRAKAQDLVSKHEVSKKVSKEKMDTEKAAVDVNAQVAADVKIRQRRDVDRSRKLVMSLFDELEVVSDNAELIRSMAKDVNGGNTDEAVRKAVGLSGRIDAVKKLTDALKTLTSIEDSVYGLTDHKGGGIGDEDQGYIIVPAKIANG